MPDPRFGSLRELAELVRRGDDPLLTIREVAALTDTPRSTLKRWIYTDRELATVPYGPTCRPRIHASVVIRFFYQSQDAPVRII
jgi:hypothetical protein